MRPVILASAFAIATATAATAQADTPYTSDQVVDFLINSVDLGEARAICIGTVEECSPEPAPGLDMMVSFDLDSHELLPEARQNLQVFADALGDERLEVARFVVEGHTDALGPADYNLGLSERRAASVSEFLIELGVEAERLEAIGLGETTPRTTDPYDPENRRVELRLNLQ